MLLVIGVYHITAGLLTPNRFLKNNCESYDFKNATNVFCISQSERAPRIKLNRETKNFSRYACNLRLMETSLYTAAHQPFPRLVAEHRTIILGSKSTSYQLMAFDFSFFLLEATHFEFASNTWCINNVTARKLKHTFKNRFVCVRRPMKKKVSQK